MTIRLRDYQETLANKIRKAFAEKYNAPLAVLPTGGGKTTIFSYVASGASSKGKTVYLVAHRAELVKQISMTLAQFGTKHQIIAPPKIIRKCKVKHFKAFNRSYVAPGTNVYVCSVDTLKKKLGVYDDPDIIIIDEAHHVTVGSKWGKVIDFYNDKYADGERKLKLLLVTATPFRLDGKGLGKGNGGYADCIIEGPTMRWLIDNGYLTDYIPIIPPQEIDLAGLAVSNGDFSNKKELNSRVDKPSITGSITKHYTERVNGKRAIAFCVSIEHSQHISDKFSEQSVSSEVLDGSLDPDEREKRLERFESAETKVMTSCEIVSEGFDLPAIEVVILARPTKSRCTFIQQVGRGARAVYAPGYDLSTKEGRLAAIANGPKPFFYIFDHVGNIGKILNGKLLLNHGFPDMAIQYSLEGLKKSGRKKKDDDDDLPDVHIQTCPKCFAIHKPAEKCPVCGHVYLIKGRSLNEQDGQLITISTESREEALRAAEIARAEDDLKRRERYEKLNEEKACKTLEDWIALGNKRGYAFSQKWAEHRFNARQSKSAAGKNAVMEF